MILETTFIIDLIKGRTNAIGKMNLLIEENIPTGIATPTIFELFSGLVSLDKPEAEKSKIIELLKEQIIYPLDKESAELAGEIDGKLVKKGITIDVEDCMIAGIAIVHNKKVLTRDEHFSRIEGLKIESY